MGGVQLPFLFSSTHFCDINFRLPLCSFYSVSIVVMRRSEPQAHDTGPINYFALATARARLARSAVCAAAKPASNAICPAVALAPAT